jgi:hypothetical protein
VAEELQCDNGMSNVALLVVLLSVASACTSSAGTDAGNGSGGSGSGGGAEDAAVASGSPFSCGDASCATGQTYCRQLAAPGGYTGSNASNTIYSYDCPALNDGCPAHDCSCVTVNQGFAYCSSCSVLDGGGVVASCGKI